MLRGASQHPLWLQITPWPIPRVWFSMTVKVLIQIKTNCMKFRNYPSEQFPYLTVRSNDLHMPKLHMGRDSQETRCLRKIPYVCVPPYMTSRIWAALPSCTAREYHYPNHTRFSRRQLGTRAAWVGDVVVHSDISTVQVQRRSGIILRQKHQRWVPFLLYLWGDPSFWPQVPHGSKRWDRFECTIFPNKASTHDIKFVLLLCLFTWLDNFLFLSNMAL